MKKVSKKIVVITVLLVLFVTLSGIGESSIPSFKSNNDFDLYIEGGIGLTIGAINYGNQTLTVSYNITTGIFGRNVVNGEFQVPPHQEIGIRTIGFSITPLSVTLSAENETLTRTGIAIMIFVIFFN